MKIESISYKNTNEVYFYHFWHDTHGSLLYTDMAKAAIVFVELLSKAT